jgi:hypothetical protein
MHIVEPDICRWAFAQNLRPHSREELLSSLVERIWFRFSIDKRQRGRSRITRHPQDHHRQHCQCPE